MGKFATLKDVAKLAGTTAATVSYVLNEKEGRYISDDMRARVLKAAEELDYIKSVGASSLKGKERKLIGLLVPQYENQFFTRIALACESVFMNEGFDIMVCNTFDNPDRERDILVRMMEQRVDGIMITPTINGVENTRVLRRVGMNMVVIDRSLPGISGYNWVSTNNYECGEQGAAYLFSKGHKKIAYVSWKSGIPDMDARFQAVLDQADEYGIAHDDVILENGEFTIESGYRMTEKIIKEHPDCTAIFYGFNIQAKGGVDYLRDKDIRIPEDLSVVLIGSPEWATTGLNNFTHVDMGDYELGKKAAEMLLEEIRNGSKGYKHIIQECTLVEGSSVSDKN